MTAKKIHGNKKNSPGSNEYRKRRFRKFRFKYSDRSGFTLVEVALALAVTTVMLVTITVTIADAERMQMETDRLALAQTIAQAKMTQLTSGVGLEVTDEQGEFGDSAGIYSGYGYEIQVREEQIDLAKVAESGTLTSSPALDDQIPAGVQNQPPEESAGASSSSVTGGLIDVYRIRVKITYPRGTGGERGEYTVETFRENKK